MLISCNMVHVKLLCFIFCCVFFYLFVLWCFAFILFFCVCFCFLFCCVEEDFLFWFLFCDILFQSYFLFVLFCLVYLFFFFWCFVLYFFDLFLILWHFILKFYFFFLFNLFFFVMFCVFGYVLEFWSFGAMHLLQKMLSTCVMWCYCRTEYKWNCTKLKCGISASLTWPTNPLLSVAWAGMDCDFAKFIICYFSSKQLLN